MKIVDIFESVNVVEVFELAKKLFPKAEIYKHSGPDGISIMSTHDFVIDDFAGSKKIKEKILAARSDLSNLTFAYDGDDDRVLIFLVKRIPFTGLKKI